MGTGRPVSAPNDTHPHWGGVVGGDAMRDAQADVPSANGFGRNLPEISVAESRFWFDERPRPVHTPQTGATQDAPFLSLVFLGTCRSVEFSRRRRRRTAHVAAILTLHRTIQSVGATGGVYKGQGRSQRELMTRAY
ncbi:hypothetical protein L6452_35171 [Arctium lappa]|uniref:Uncharacterized protein n=1 Tax=Arctium lappa TaxID=4217 RepID=A0ACB8YPG0_ARCLA|nr:hypothetical protein L6452_35171 [Arctium lappa]